MTISAHNEDRLRTALAVLADAAPVGVEFERLTNAALIRPRRRWSGPAVLATAVIATLVAFAPLLWRGNEATGRVGPTLVAVPRDAPPPGSVAPFLESPPDWFGEPVAGARAAALRTGRWVSTAIGVDGGGGRVTAPLTVSVTDGAVHGLDRQEVILGGQTYELLGAGGWHGLASVGEPTVIVTGAVDTAILKEVLDGTQVVATDAGDSVSVIRLPAGYEHRVPPQLQAEDVSPRRTLANADGDVSINEVSDWVQPELAAAYSGADYRHVNVGGRDGWTAYTEFNSYGPLTFLVWSPQPGVVFEIVTANEEHTIDQLVELANATSVISSAAWDEALGQ